MCPLRTYLYRQGSEFLKVFFGFSSPRPLFRLPAVGAQDVNRWVAPPETGATLRVEGLGTGADSADALLNP
jgi:hypothetical protein